MAKDNERPGVMIYHDIRPSLALLNNEQKGQLFDAILAYSEDGCEPAFIDLGLAILWTQLKPQIDRSNARYEKTIIQRKYAVYCREEKRAGRDPMAFEDYCSSTDADRSSTDINYNDNVNLNLTKTYPNQTVKVDVNQCTAVQPVSTGFQQSFAHECDFESKREAAISKLEAL